jgi:spermidine synthase
MSDIPDILVHNDYWNGHLVEIKDHGDHRSLYFASEHLQSRMSLSRPHELVLSYTWYMILALLIQPDLRNILIIGIGSGSFVRFFSHHFPACRIDAVDYSQHIIDAARGYFHLPENPGIVVHCRDGCRFLEENRDKRYDLILVDAFDDQGMAPTVYAPPFFALCAASLAAAGVVSCNLWSSDEVRYRELRTIITDHFPGALFLPVPDRGNVVALAMTEPVPWSRITLKSGELAELTQRYAIDFKQLVRVATHNNLSLAERFMALFHS